MELDSIWDEGFYSMVSDELDYEFDENDLFNNEDNQETYKDEKGRGAGSYMQSGTGGNSILEDRKDFVQLEQKESNNFPNFNLGMDMQNNTSQLSFANRQDFQQVKTEIIRNNSVDCDTSNNQIIVDARIFLDSDNKNKQFVNSVSSNPHNQSHELVDQAIHLLVDENRPLENNARVGDGYQDVKRKKKDKKHKLNKPKIKSEPNTALFSLESTEELGKVESIVDKRKIDSRHASQNKPEASVKAKSLKAENLKTYSKKKNLSKDSDKNKFPSTGKNILAIKRESLKPEPEEPGDQEIPKDTDTDASLPDKKAILSIKHEHIKTEFTKDNNVYNAKLVLTRLPDDVLYGIPVRSDFHTIKPKAEIVEMKPVLRLNLLHLQKARVMLKKLSTEDLRSPKALLKRVKSEIDEKVSQKLKSQGKATNKDFIHRYCCNCRSLQVERQGLSKKKKKKKNCETCDTQLIYLCPKCNEKHYMDYYSVQRHVKRCRGSGESKPVLDSIVLHRCTDCTFKTTYSQAMASHVRRKGHKADGEIDVNKVPMSPKARVRGEASKELMSPKIPRTRYAKLIVNQNDSRVAAVTERYCSKCNKSQSSKTRKLKESCNTCDTPLQLHCLKCNFKHKSYHSMLSHLRAKCQPNSYKCAKCDYTNSIWSLTQQHVMDSHDKRAKVNETVKSPKKRRPTKVLRCGVCTFETKYAHSLDRHAKRLHQPK